MMIAKTMTDRRVFDAVDPVIRDMGFETVRVRLMAGETPTLQIMAERPDGEMGVEDCARLSDVIEALLDVEDIIASAYNLEISSPGLDRPLTRIGDFIRNIGREARLELDEPLSGRRRFRGRILHAADAEAGEVSLSMVRLSADQGKAEFDIPFARISEAKIILTDEDFAGLLRRQSAEEADNIERLVKSAAEAGADDKNAVH